MTKIISTRFHSECVWKKQSKVQIIESITKYKCFTSQIQFIHILLWSFDPQIFNSLKTISRMLIRSSLKYTNIKLHLMRHQHILFTLYRKKMIYKKIVHWKTPSHWPDRYLKSIAFCKMFNLTALQLSGFTYLIQNQTSTTTITVMKSYTFLYIIAFANCLKRYKNVYT